MTDLYLPPSTLIELGFSQPRRWSTKRIVGPSGREQVSPMFFRPKKRLSSVTILNADVVSFSATTARDRERDIRDLFDQVGGMTNWFWIFNPIAGDYSENRIKITVVSGVMTNLPLTFPYIGGTEPTKTSVAFSTPVFDQGGFAGEWRLTALDVSAAPDGTYNSEWEILGASQGFKAKLTDDLEDWSRQWDAADPAATMTISVEEFFG